MFKQALVAAAAVASVSAVNVKDNDEDTMLELLDFEDNEDTIEATKDQLLSFAQVEAEAEVELKAQAQVEQDNFNRIHLAKHNEYRRRHGVPELVYDPTLANQAAQWSRTMARAGRLYHSSRSQRNNAGENLAWTSSSRQATTTWATEAWYEEIDDPGYNFNRPGYQSGTGHFTQVVWKSSEKLGCANVNNYITCHYFPAGNITNRGYFEQNVLPPGGNSNDDSDDSDDNNNDGDNQQDDDDDQDANCPARTFVNCANEFYRVFAPLPRRRLITLNAYFCFANDVVYFREAIDICISLY